MASNSHYTATLAISILMAHPGSATSLSSNTSPTKSALSTGQRTLTTLSLAYHPSSLATSTPAQSIGSPLVPPLMSIIPLMRSIPAWAMQT